MNKEEVISKVQKLLRKADKNVFLEEAQTCMEMANKLLGKYHLSMSEIMTVDDNMSSNSSIDLVEHIGAVFKAPTVPKWMSLLVSAINQITQTKTLVRYITTRKDKSYGELKIIFVGDQTDVKVAIELFSFLRNCITRLSTTHVKETQGKFQQWRSFAEGCSTKILQRALQIGDEKWNLKDYQSRNTDDTDVENRYVDDDDDDVDIEIDDDDDSDDVDDDNDTQQEGSSETSVEQYALYLATKKEKIDEYIESKEEEIEKETVTNSSKLDPHSYDKGQVAAEKLPLKILTQIDKKKRK